MVMGDHSMKSTKQYFPVVRGTPYYALHGGSNS